MYRAGAMLAYGEPKYNRPRRLCIGVSWDMGKPIYAEGFGEWKHEDFTFLNEDSDSSLSDNGFQVTFTEERLFWWACNWNEVHAEELEMTEERDRCHEEALLHDREEKESLQYLIASCETFRSPSPEVDYQRASSSCEASG